MRLIDAKELEKQVKEVFKENPVVMGMLLRWLRKQPTIDAVPVVRCKDCKHWDCYMNNPDGTWYGNCECHTNGFRNESDFCSYGERKEGDG